MKNEIVLFARDGENVHALKVSVWVWYCSSCQERNEEKHYSSRAVPGFVKCLKCRKEFHNND